jgi:HlyD family secretion protein
MANGQNALADLKIHRPERPARSRAPLFLVIAVLLFAGGAITWWLTRTKPVSVSTASARVVSEQGAATLLNASGYVTARRAATVSSKVTGRVVEVLIEEGMRVQEGQLLARIDATNVQASLRLAEAQLTSARGAIGETRATLDQAQRTLRRTSLLSDNKVTSEAELENARADAEMLEARLKRQEAEVAVAERNVEVWRQQLEDTNVRAPFEGVVTAKNAQPGEIISPLSAGGGFTRTGICTIVDMSSLEVEVDVNESYINRVSAGQPVMVTLDSYPDWHIPSKVIAIIPTADRQKATVRVRVGFDALDSRILPDMGLKVAFQSTDGGASARRMVAVPKNAIRRGSDGKTTVFVVREGVVERRAVSVGIERGDDIFVLSGLEGGEKVVTTAPENLGDGARVVENQL